jgi:flagellar biogenesis protein FliO
MRPILVLGGIFALMGAVLFLVIRVRNVRRSGSPSAGAGGKITGVLGKLMDQTLGARREKMIDVVATHNLGPKKSITIVRISGRLLVLGVSGESINLIAQLPDRTDAPSNSEVERILNAEMEAEARRAEGHLTEPLEAEALEQFLDSGKSLGYSAATNGAASGAVSARRNAFQDTLSAKIQPGAGNSAPFASGPARESVRDRIKNRVQGMKQL